MLRSPPRYSDPSLPPLDDADVKLVQMLMLDGRASGRDLAQRTGLSEANVSRRLARLIDERSVRIIGFVPPEYLGLTVQFTTYIRVRGDVDSVATDMSRHPAFSFISAGFGAWDLILFGVAPDSPSVTSILDEAVLAHPHVHLAETRTVLEFADATRRVEPHHALHAPRDIDATDRQIIRQVQADGRMSFTDVANNTGISATSAADRFRKLSSDGILRVLTLPDPTRIGLNLSGVMSLQVSRPAREVIARLAAFPEVSFLCVMTGSHPVAFEFNVRDGAHFDDLRARILRTEGVLTDQTTVHRKLHRQSFVWG
ncbi:MAG: Lrp/AsnC family transcriptional regulator [Phycisphaerales bacterium]|jgi:Lrp/AsnC family transcriptional regulator for asnA, asnC and gidA